MTTYKKKFHYNNFYTGKAETIELMVLFGCAMFDNMVSVYELNCLDEFFSYPPSRMKKWKQGIKALNPFSEMKEYSDGTVTTEDLDGYNPYTLQQYILDIGR